MCGMKLMGRKETNGMMHILGIKETIDYLAEASSICWYGHV